MIRVLLVEDEEVIRNGLMYTIDWLSMDAAVIDSAADGEDGLLKIQALHPDVVITDIRMPIMNGLDMIRAANNQNITFIPILLTSYSDFDYAKQAIELHVFDYILKPVDDDKLAIVMEHAKIQVERNHEIKRLHDAVDQAVSGGLIVLKTDSENPYINRCLQCIQQNYCGHPSIELIAAELNVSQSYLSRLFKRHMSMTFLDFLNRYRIRKAVEMLSSGTYKVYEVAAKTGFSEYKRFYEVFKSYTGISPTDFVKTGCCVVKKG